MDYLRQAVRIRLATPERLLGPDLVDVSVSFIDDRRSGVKKVALGVESCEAAEVIPARAPPSCRCGGCQKLARSMKALNMGRELLKS
ncbi:hypothetical protein Pstu01_33020 [Stutzerimonas stutzeri]|nr:hypothetical protein Pstu01_33020 [Stutzerimonas stutzeri]